jgi:1-acyl-sn-glycerol-3-phosphate acyltransferase
LKRVADPDPAKARKDWFFRGFRDRYVLGYVRKHFHAVRLSLGSHPIPPADGPVIVVPNHPSWWDPMMFTVLSREFGRREHFGVIDAPMLKKYGFFSWIGLFGVEPNSVRGAATFLRVATKLLAGSNHVFWITAQGDFADVRKRPLNLRSGVGHLVARLPKVTVLPMALEYPFWTERTPEALVRFGQPIVVTDPKAHDGAGWTALIEAALTETLDTLNKESLARDPAAFRTLLGGKAGVGGFYQRWQAIKAKLAGKRFDPAHRSPIE